VTVFDRLWAATVSLQRVDIAQQTVDLEFRQVESGVESVTLVRAKGVRRLSVTVNGHVEVPAGGHEKSPPPAVSQGLADGPPALVLASFIR
jgi:hypothetical protein